MPPCKGSDWWAPDHESQRRVIVRKIALAIAEQCITLTDIAKRAELPLTTLNRYFYHGLLPSMFNLTKLSLALDVSLDSLVDRDAWIAYRKTKQADDEGLPILKDDLTCKGVPGGRATPILLSNASEQMKKSPLLPRD